MISLKLDTFFRLDLCLQKLSMARALPTIEWKKYEEKNSCQSEEQQFIKQS